VLWQLDRAAPDRARGRLFRVAAWVMVGLMWSIVLDVGLLRTVTAPFFGLRVVHGVWLLRELCCWWLISLLLGVVVCFLQDAPALAGWRRRVAD